MNVRDRAGSADDVVVARLHALAPHLDGEPDPAWQATTRSRLVAMAAVRGPEPAPISPLRRLLAGGLLTPARRRTHLTAALSGAALTVTALATLTAVATEARPGDVLYGLKRGTEQTQLALAGDERGEVLLDLAGTRLDEVRALVDTGATALPAAGRSPSGGTVLAAGPDPALVVEALGAMDAHTAEGAAWLTGQAVDTGDPEPLQHLADWTARQSEELAGLRDDVPATAADEVVASLGLLSDVAARVDGLESSLSCADGPAVRTADGLGPVPAPCAPGDSPASAPGAPIGGGSTAGPGVPDSSPPGVPEPLPGSPVPPVGGNRPAVPGGGSTPVVPSLSPGAVPTTAAPSVTPPLPTLPGALPTVPDASPAASAGTGASAPPSGTTTVEVCLPPLVISGC